MSTQVTPPTIDLASVRTRLLQGLAILGVVGAFWTLFLYAVGHDPLELSVMLGFGAAVAFAGVWTGVQLLRDHSRRPSQSRQPGPRLFETTSPL